LVSWQAEFELTSMRVAELEGKITLQREAIRQLSAKEKDTTTAQQLLRVREQNLERLLIYRAFVESRLGT
jgi:hypothetical protein